MTEEREYVISLSRLTLPCGNLTSKVTISLLADGAEQFIAKERVVRGGKVNLFRQSLFLPTDVPSFQLRLYSLDHPKPLLLCSFPVHSQQLLSLARYPAMFHIARDGYELVWEGALFCEDSELNEPTERDYSELAVPFIHSESQHNHSYTPAWLDQSPAGPKRPTSTEASSNEEQPSRSQAVRDELSLNVRRAKPDKSISAPRPGQFKNQIYSSFLNSLNGLFAASSC